ncbi:hypothetical protein PR048_023237 [Dryococelus australis]|uniref:Uncharacterized protein n=1 Tax=Dryococelus australis TaxID=614101 RepID=A0ABQ9GTI2_9NEOP|nr:hypothetical protein PR048_023237 [Dryococelus australis]
MPGIEEKVFTMLQGRQLAQVSSKSAAAPRDEAFPNVLHKRCTLALKQTSVTQRGSSRVTNKHSGVGMKGRGCVDRPVLEISKKRVLEWCKGKRCMALNQHRGLCNTLRGQRPWALEGASPPETNSGLIYIDSRVRGPQLGSGVGEVDASQEMHSGVLLDDLGQSSPLKMNSALGSGCSDVRHEQFSLSGIMLVLRKHLSGIHIYTSSLDFTGLRDATRLLSFRHMLCTILSILFRCVGASAAERLACSPPAKAFPVPPPFLFRRCSILTSTTPVGSQDLDVKNRPNIFTHSVNEEMGDDQKLTILYAIHVKVRTFEGILPVTAYTSKTAKPPSFCRIPLVNKEMASELFLGMMEANPAPDLDRTIERGVYPPPLPICKVVASVSNNTTEVSSVSTIRRDGLSHRYVHSKLIQHCGIEFRAYCIFSLQCIDRNTVRLARRSDEALGVRVSVARIAPSLIDLARVAHAGDYVAARPGSRSEGAIRATLTRAPSASSLLRARHHRWVWKYSVRRSIASGDTQVLLRDYTQLMSEEGTTHLNGNRRALRYPHQASRFGIGGERQETANSSLANSSEKTLLPYSGSPDPRQFDNTPF